jgi:hypothetical protein
VLAGEVAAVSDEAEPHRPTIESLTIQTACAFSAIVLTAYLVKV